MNKQTYLIALVAWILGMMASLRTVELAHAEGPNAIVSLAGCTTSSLPREDDSPSALAGLPFTLNFFGTNYNSAYVNNNGNVTFDSALSAYTPFGLVGTNHVIIAPFFADVDTRGGSGVTTYGATTFGSNQAFCVNWINVGYFNSHTDKLNSFQLLLVKSTNPGDFDIIFNYDKVLWETGDSSGGVSGLGGSSAHIGYSNGLSGSSNRSLELPGSGTPGSFLNSNTATGLIYNSRASLQLGRYILPVRNGMPPAGGTISGAVYKYFVAPANIIAGASIAVCDSSTCPATAVTNANGQYSVSGLPANTYTVFAFPPGTLNLLPNTISNVTLPSGGTLTNQNILVYNGTAPPPGTTLTPSANSTSNIPVVPMDVPLTLVTHHCSGGTASYVLKEDFTSNVLRSGPMIEGPAGTYTAIVSPLFPFHGHFHVTITVTCPNGGVIIDFDGYSDPSGVVTNTAGTLISGATVILYRADSAGGPFTQVPNGSGIMSLSNRNNPDTTNTSGQFGWDVLAGFYKVRAQKTGCSSPDNSSQPYVETGVLQIPPRSQVCNSSSGVASRDSSACH